MTPDIKNLSFLGATFINAVCEKCRPENYYEGLHKGYGDDVEPVTKREMDRVVNLAGHHENKTGHRVVIYTASKG